jgi:hypothetical protein
VLDARPYEPGSHECCCGNPDCTEFEDRMAAWGIPLDEITTVEFEVSLNGDVSVLVQEDLPSPDTSME